MSKFKREGWPTLAPRIFTDDVAGVVGFLKSVFDADGVFRADGPAEMRIGDSIVMVSNGGGEREPTAGFLYVYVPDADETYRRAITAGAKSVEKAVDMPYGDRRATVRDPWGNTWQIATYKGDG
ncbi:MAG: VOC family protein [Hyphomicrobiaceae bacterium]|nr:VOC family protein [Hyphomicrobiaceae bacterium]